MKRCMAMIPVFALAACSSSSPQGDPIPSSLGGKADQNLAILDWQDPTNVFPARLTATSADYSATNCEFYVDSVADGNFANGGVTARWVQAAIVANTSQPGTIVEVGMYTETSDGGRTVTLGHPSSGNQPGHYDVGFTYFENFEGIDNTIFDFAFYIDVKRSDTETVRLWVSDQGNNFTMKNTFAHASDPVTTGGTSLRYAASDAFVFHQKQACD
jgi:hypothetical protein